MSVEVDVRGVSTVSVSAFNVLLVDDNRVSQKIGLRLLSSLGFSADIATNGREALECCDRGTYSLILMDCQMPEMDGLEATRVLRQKSPHHPPLVIALTAHDTAEERQKCLDAGMHDCLTKQITREQLAATIERWMPQIQAQVLAIRDIPPTS